MHDSHKAWVPRLVEPDERAPDSEAQVLEQMAEELAALSRSAAQVAQVADQISRRAGLWRAWALDRVRAAG